MSGFAVEPVDALEVVAAWVAPKKTIPAVESSPGWFVLGEYFLPKSTMAFLDVAGCVSHESLTLRVRLWDVEAKAAVPGVAEIRSVAGQRSKGVRVQLIGNRSYQVQAECTGAVGDDRFGVVETATISD
jgi:hypothetical protein